VRGKSSGAIATKAAYCADRLAAQYRFAIAPYALPSDPDEAQDQRQLIASTVAAMMRDTIRAYAPAVA